MLKTLHVALLACLAAPLAMAADEAPKHEGHHMEPPAAAFTACEGKQAGDKGSFTGPDGKAMSGVCHDMKGKLALMPERAGGKGVPDGEGRMGPPPEAFKACEGKSSGDKVTISGPEGKTLSGVCHDMKGKLAAMPEHKSGGHPQKED